MKKRPIFHIVALCALLALLGVFLRAPALAQNYSFAVPELLMHVIVQPDSSATIIYDITFQNYGSAIDIVDIGTPHSKYNIGNMSASIDGVALTDIRKSEYVNPGVEVHLGSKAIPSGGKGTLHFEMTMPEMIFTDTTNKENASLQITPTWFDSSLVRGTGTIEIRVTLLEGIQLDEVLYQDVAFTDKGTENGRVVTVWRFENVAATKEYRVGVSFPQRGLTNITKVTAWDLFVRWISQFLGGISILLSVCLPFVIPLFIFWLIVRGIIKASKPNYLPPIAQVEGGGIKRGLTAPEAAVILEMPLNKVLALVIFGMLEKKLVRQTDDTPLKVEVAEPYRVADKADLKDAEARAAYRRTVAQQQGTVIHKYEDAFLDLIEAHPDKPVKQLNVVAAMEGLVKGAAAKMQGFDLSDTQDYYRRVIERAMQQAAALGDIEQREQYLDQYAPWVMMDKDYRTVMTVGGYNYWPRWVRQTRPVAAGGAASTAGAAGSAASGRPAPKFGDVASSFAGWAETTMGGMAAAIMPTSLQKPAPPSTSSSSGGGFHSSCACACAGCACACACAGGGR
ncbi:MAG TPA: hypothetical protein PKZ84_01490 [Anaerolineae bacterium]|nr:hypothetical protein [Anaerolineae bacterium]HQI83071.1 hypothetical protein [Anaerolineae bacterium]